MASVTKTTQAIELRIREWGEDGKIIVASVVPWDERAGVELCLC